METLIYKLRIETIATQIEKRIEDSGGLEFLSPFS